MGDRQLTQSIADAPTADPRSDQSTIADSCRTPIIDSSIAIANHRCPIVDGAPPPRPAPGAAGIAPGAKRGSIWSRIATW